MQRTLAAGKLATLLDGFDRSPAYRGLAERLRSLVADGRIPAGVRLPSERDLTAALAVSRTTVTRAYAQLREQGYLDSRQGSGSLAALPASRAHRGDHLLPPGVVDRPGAIDLTCAASAAVPGTLAAYERAVAALPAHLGGTGYFPSGLPELREAIAARYGARGLPTDPDQVIVTAGALAGLAIAARAVLSAGDRILLESPTYPNAVATVEHTHARVVSTDVDPSGWDVAHLVATVRQVAPRVAYLIPDFHNPTGALMPDEHRARVGAALTRARAVAVVDESMADLAIDDELVDAMPAPFATHCADTVSIGSLSKPVWGGLRIGWLRVPAQRVTACFRARLSLDLGAALLEQLVAVELFAEYDAVLAERRSLLRSSRDAARDALAEHLPQWRINAPRGGLSLWCELPAPLSSALTLSAERHDVLLASGPSFAPEGGYERWLRLPYTMPADTLTEAIERLALAWADTEQRPVSGRSRPTLVA